MRWSLAAIAASWIAAGFTPAAGQSLGDATRGADLFKNECSACHQVGSGAQNRIGPKLNGVFGRRAGSIEGFKYSKSIARMGADGLEWHLETLDAYLTNPKTLVSGTRMNYPGLAKPEDRAAILAYLRLWSDNPRDIPEADPTASKREVELDPAVLAIQGDPDFGQYLSSECTTCHQSDGSDKGIPSITNWPTQDFVMAMHAYKRKLRPHPVMQMMAGRLSDDEIAALAAYFEGVD
ncbi:unnamed protein product [Ciceribacter sp. T2.26MG-112.2]|uniref:c-type cytochrome n=1 Tax=Ciceribacter sp. T2.26MG-112.2 TaxID=3137154 RepID=UPI000E1AA12C|nr:c-type cytochrome [Ciceribacter naphthalenivorans]SSC70940.1 unnamed protein product [Ciceribacter naphthalenivorans]